LNKRYIYLVIVATFFVIVSIWGIVFFQNSTIEKVVHKRGALKILEKIESTNGTFVIYDKGDKLKGEILKQGLWGWETIMTSQVLNDRSNPIETVIRTDHIGSVYIDGNGYYFGYVNPNKADFVKFQNEQFTISYNVQSYYWYFPILSEEDSKGFKAEQFSVILKDGTEVYYPFDDL
jgi:hypothetical protein